MKPYIMGSYKIIAVDFDGTLVEDSFPEIGHPIPMIITKIIAEQKKGSKIILWTNRTGARLVEAVEFCERVALRFDAVNENLPEIIKKYGGDSRKITADEYWDDRAYNPRFVRRGIE